MNQSPGKKIHIGASYRLRAERQNNYHIKAYGTGRIENYLLARLHLDADVKISGNARLHFHFQDARKMLEATRCDGIMIGRGILRNPWLFKEVEEDKEVAPKRMAKLIREHFHLLLEEVPDERRAVAMFRKFAGWYSRGIRGAAVFRRTIQSMETADDLFGNVHAFFGEG